jgi:digeranylgeranylglycerophospholipid reductase
MEDEPDVLVVGGGPAGLAVARELARLGRNALVVEREEEIGRPVHTSGATAVSTLDRFQLPRTCGHGVSTIAFIGPSERHDVVFDREVLAILDVTGTYQFLARNAEFLGATVACSSRFERVVRDGSRIAGAIVKSGSEERHIRARVLVDASGYRAAVAKASGLHAGFDRFGVGAEYEYLAPRVDQTRALLIVGSEFAPAGYGWVFPWGQDRVRIGVGVHHADVRDDPRELLDRMIAATPRIGVDLTGASQVDYHRGLIPSARVPNALAGNGVLAVGDAGSQATLVVGEGIRVSLDAGTMAARAIDQALTSGDVSARGLAPYERQFRASYGRSARMGYSMNRRLAKLQDSDWDDSVRLLRRLPGEFVLDVLQAEFSLASVLRAIARRPLLAPRLARYAVEATTGRRLGRGRRGDAPGHA